MADSQDVLLIDQGPTIQTLAGQVIELHEGQQRISAQLSTMTQLLQDLIREPRRLPCTLHPQYPASSSVDMPRSHPTPSEGRQADLQAYITQSTETIAIPLEHDKQRPPPRRYLTQNGEGQRNERSKISKPTQTYCGCP